MTTPNNSFPLEGSRALLLGATKGIGFALAGQLLAQGARVTISGRSEDTVATAIARLRTANSCGTRPSMRWTTISASNAKIACGKSVAS